MNPAQALCGPGKVSMIRQMQSLNPVNLAAWRALTSGSCVENHASPGAREK